MKNFVFYYIVLLTTIRIEAKVLVIPHNIDARKLLLSHPLNEIANKKSFLYKQQEKYKRRLNTDEPAEIHNEHQIHEEENHENHFLPSAGHHDQQEEENYVPSNYQTHTVETREKNINNILHSVIKSTDNHQEKPVIIINHQEIHHVPRTPRQQDNNPSPIQHNEPVERPSTVNDMNNVSIDDMESLEKILDNIANIYTNFYQKLPEETDQSSLEEYDPEKMNEYMIKLKTFTRDVIMNSENLMNEINYFQRKVHLIKSGENEMVGFFKKEQTYAKLKTQSALMDQEDIKDNWTLIASLSEEYNQMVKDIYRHSYELYKFNVFFANQIKQINNSGSTQGEENTVNKFDQVLMFSIRLIEVKVDIEKAIAELKTCFQTIKTISFKVEQILMDLEQIIRKREIEIREEEEALLEKQKLEEIEKNKFVSVFKTVLALFFVFLFS